MFLPQGSYSLAARARLQPLHGAREPTARVACSGEAVQGCAKANANRIELVELENVIGDHPRAGLTEGPVSQGNLPPEPVETGKWWSSATRSSLALRASR